MLLRVGSLLAIVLLCAIATTLPVAAAADADRYEGKYCEGVGDTEFLRLIDESFAFFHPTPDVPNVSMLYQPDWDTFAEGAGWYGWWVNNSYGFGYCSIPFLPQPWFSVLERANKIWYDGQGDGKSPNFDSTVPQFKEVPNVAPEGCLPEVGRSGGIVGCEHILGDGDPKQHDWSLTSTAVAITLQAELLLAKHDEATVREYLPKMEKASAFLESRRDPNNGLLLAGAGSTLQGPDYAGTRRPDGTYDKAYLAMLSVNYCAALDRMIELCKLAGDMDRQKEYEQRKGITQESLSRLLTPEGYFLKSIDLNGAKHGVVGQKPFGYFCAWANVDAAALRVVDDTSAANIYRQISALPELRPFDFVITNDSSLDDTYYNWGGGEPKGFDFLAFGCWANGGVWGTLEGRAILMYYRLGKFNDIRRSAGRAMKWAKEFRMDAPWSQRGENTSNPWSDTGINHVGGVAVMVDNFAIPAATIRGLFDYEYRSDRLILRPRVPPTITEYVQKAPIRFGDKRLHISCHNGGMKVLSVAVNGKPVKVNSPEAAVLTYDELPAKATVEIVTGGGWGVESPLPATPPTPAATTIAAVPQVALPESLRKPYAVLTTMEALLAKEPNAAEADRTFVSEAIRTIEAWRERTGTAPQGFFRPMTVEKRDSIVAFYEKAAANLYNGFARRMAAYAQSPDPDKQHMAELFQQAQQL